jgi:xanthosine utilization system XapX-like protein/DNA-directed RNA polymerase subunit RPC12/RpoP
MKCINCGTDNNLRDRKANYGKCSKCGHPFVFEPTSMVGTKLTDPMFAKAISDISVNQTLFFTPKQMLYFLDNRLKAKASTGIGCIYILYIVLLFIFNTVVVSSGDIFVGLIVNMIYQMLSIMFANSGIKHTKINAATRKVYRQFLIFVGVITLMLGMLYSVALNSFPVFVIAVLLGMFAIYIGTTSQNLIIAQEFLIGESTFQDWLKRWQEINGNIQKLLSAPQKQNNQTTPINPDVTAYSFDRLIVCDSAEIAQFLIANNFHFENNCAILSITGYPESIFETTMDMLRRNSELKVYALHSCTPRGLGLVNHLKTNPKWFQNSNVSIIDIGITPRQVFAAKKNIFVETSPQSSALAKQLSNEICNNFTHDELQWLQKGNFVNLESFKPQQLIQIIQRGIANTLNLDSDSALFMAGSSDTYIYTSESFG